MVEMKTLTIGDETFEIVDAKARLKILPDVSADDNGKFLRVADGAWAAATINNAEEGSF